MKDIQPKLGFTLKKIVTDQFAIITDGFKEGKDNEMSIQFSFAINPIEKLLGVKANIQFRQKKAVFLLGEVSCHFEITDDTWVSLQSMDKIIFPKGFIQHLAMITVGTTRGVLHAKTENTDFNKFIIPTINLTEVLKDDVEFEIT